LQQQQCATIALDLGLAFGCMQSRIKLLRIRRVRSSKWKSKWES